MNVILIGYRGCGKTTVGQAVADRLGWVFVDTDDAVRARFGGRTIAEIWARDGEPAFREAEADVLRERLGDDRQVLGLGGGAVIQPAGRRIVERAGDALRVYLACDAGELHRRIHADPSRATRPDHGGHRSRETFIRDELTRRAPVYEAVAELTLDAAAPVATLVDRIVARIARDHRQ